MDIGHFWAKARPLDSDRGPQWHPLAYHSLDVAAVGDALLRSHPRLNESFARLLGLPPEDTASLIRYLLCLHDIGKFAKKFQAKMPYLLPDCFGDELAKLATRFDHGAGGLRLFDADPDRFLLPHGARPRAWPPLIAATVADAHEVRRLEAGCVVVGLDKGLHKHHTPLYKKALHDRTVRNRSRSAAPDTRTTVHLSQSSACAIRASAVRR